MEFLSRVLKGLVVGVANIIPGVSGGTMAVVMGIYDRLIGAVSDLRRDFKNSLLYSFSPSASEQCWELCCSAT